MGSYVRRYRLRVIGLIPLAAALSVIVLFALQLGAVHASWSEVFRVTLAHCGGRAATPYENAIVWQLHAPRVLLALVVGGALAGSGAVFQALFRNPMADPYVIGVSSGAAVGAVGEMLVAGSAAGRLLAGPWLSRPLWAALLGVGTVLVVYRLAMRRGRIQSDTLLLSGIAVSLLLSAVLTLLLYRAAGGQELTGILFWLMGGLSNASWSDVGAALPWVSAGLLIALALARWMNVLLTGEETAHHLGVSPERVRRLLVAAATVATAAAVSVSGIIGFVGLIIPHVVRLVWGPDHRVLLPASVLAGAAFLVLADAAARSILAPQELPVGVITAFAGAPFFLGLLRARSHRPL